MAPSILKSTFTTLFSTLVIAAIGYAAILSLLLIFPSLEAHAIYLHGLTLTGAHDLNVPEQFGFSLNQVTSFNIPSSDGVELHAWHILPPATYQKHHAHAALTKNNARSPAAPTLGLNLLRNDPDARLVLYMHGASGTLASGWRPASYWALSAAAPNKIHVLTFDYRGYGLSTGVVPTEQGVLQDATAVARWALDVAQIPPERIVVYGQSLGSAVAISLVEQFCSQTPSVAFAGLVITAAFSNVASLAETYRINGVVPILGPIRRFPLLLNFFTSRLRSTWSNKRALPNLVQQCPRHHITLIHAEDDPIIPSTHSHSLYWHAVNATLDSENLPRDRIDQYVDSAVVDMGPAGYVSEWVSKKGIIRKDILLHGDHDKLMAYPVTSRAILRAFKSIDEGFGGSD